MTTQSELIELSKAAAKVAEVEPYTISDHPERLVDWLHEDSARCFELMCRYGMKVSPTLFSASVDMLTEELMESADCCREQATRVAILKAIVAVGEQK